MKTKRTLKQILLILLLIPASILFVWLIKSAEPEIVEWQENGWRV